jgi:amidase
MGKSTACDSTFPTLTNQLYQLASGAITSDELVRRSLHAILASQSTLNAFRVVLTEQALADAAKADRDRAAGKQLPLLGIPIAVKDDVDIAGVPTRFGTEGNVRVAAADSEVVRRLRAAGAVIVGKTNTCELGQWPFTSGPGFGHTRNPWSRKHTPGGSSGGSAAAVAAGLVTAAIGSDGAGSVRIPAAWTHVVGIKPQRGRISTWPQPEAFNGITTHGVLARTVVDAALVLDAASGNADGDLHRPAPIQAADFVGVAPGPLRVAMSTKIPFTGFRAKVHPEIRAALQAMADHLGALGHTVVNKDPNYSARMSWDFLARSTAGLLDWTDRLEGQGVVYDERTVVNMRIGRLLSENVLRKARAHEAAVQRRMSWIFNLVDVIIAPTTAQPPPPAHDYDRLGWFATERNAIAACPLTWPWNLLGWPSISVPAGFTSDGLPIGVQLMGPAESEPLLLSLAAELEAITGWAAKQPPVWWNTPEGRSLTSAAVTSDTVTNGRPRDTAATPEAIEVRVTGDDASHEVDDVSQAVAAVNALR